ncbi:hypothetical protein JNW88_09570 [Micromonospora sp. ATA32]|nr:hypothetical protein [Micromonospora sp. ATA32]
MPVWTTESWTRRTADCIAPVVKLADAVVDAHAAAGDERVLAAAGYAGQLI